MDVQVILHEGQPEYAVLPWAQYQALLKAAGQELAAPVKAETAVSINPGFQALRQLREAQGLSLQELARQVGISPHYLNMIEAGEREADSAIRRSLARALGVTGWSES